MAINTSKVLVGGIVGGIVANVIDYVSGTFITGGMQRDAFTKLNASLGANPTGSQIAGLVILDFILIITTVWIYAAIRPRFGPGPRTAVYAGLAAWVIGGVAFGFLCVLNVIPSNLYLASGAVELVNIVVSTVVGAKFYTEEAAA